jgi:hypothetical protein
MHPSMASASRSSAPTERLIGKSRARLAPRIYWGVEVRALLVASLLASLCERSCGNGILTMARSTPRISLPPGGAQLPGKEGVRLARRSRSGLPAGPTLRLRGGATEEDQRLRILQVLHDCLEATLSPDGAMRKQGESTLRSMQHEAPPQSSSPLTSRTPGASPERVRWQRSYCVITEHSFHPWLLAPLLSMANLVELQNFIRGGLQGYLAHKKLPPPRTLQKA